MTTQPPYDQERELRAQGKDPATLRAHGIETDRQRVDRLIAEGKAIMFNGVPMVPPLTYQQIIDREA